MTLETRVGLVAVSILRDLTVEAIRSYEANIPIDLLIQYSQLNNHIKQEEGEYK